MTVVVTSLGIITTHEAKVFVEPGTLLVWSAAIVFSFVVSMSLYWAWKDPERCRLRDGRATRYTLNFLARHPDRLIVGPRSVELWEEAVKRISEKEAREREQEASEHRVQNLESLVQVQGGVSSGTCVLLNMSQIIAALEAFPSVNALCAEAPYHVLRDIYKPLADAVLGFQLELLGEMSVWQDDLIRIWELQDSDRDFRLNRCQELVSLLHAEIDQRGQRVFEVPDDKKDLVSRLLVLIHFAARPIEFMQY